MRGLAAMSALVSLQNSLSVITTRLAKAQLNEAGTMSRTAGELESRYENGRAPDTDIVLKVISRFLHGGDLTAYADIKNACYGVTTPYQGNNSLISHKDRFEALLLIVERLGSQPKKLKRCFQALMNTYFSLDGAEKHSHIHHQWVSLRDHLEHWLPHLMNITPRPDWLAGAIEHRNLFGPNPTARYGTAILHNDNTEFDKVCETLGIGFSSWVRRCVVLSAVDAATSQSDSIFLTHVNSLIELLRRNEAVKREGVTRLLNRYSKQNSTPDHMTLRVLSIDTFGNPLITNNQQRWFEVSKEARNMVATWLKGFLIERFFELLSHDGKTDKRRPEFWKKYLSSIESMWFLLGRTAMSNWNEDFKKLRETMGNQCLSLEGSTASNNAFVMKLRGAYIVEFGEKGNAAFVYSKDVAPFALTGRTLNVSRLKTHNYADRLLHKDGLEQWENKFAQALSKYGIYPDDPHSSKPTRNRRTVEPSASTAGVPPPPNLRQLFKQFCNERGLRYDDRAPSGRLVAYTDSSNSAISGKLTHWGFVYERDHRRWVKSG